MKLTRLAPLLAIILLFAPAASSVAPEVFPEGVMGIPWPCDPPDNGEWVIFKSTIVVCEDRTIEAHNVSISGELVLRNVELVIDSAAYATSAMDGDGYDEMSRIKLQDAAVNGGRFIASDSIIRPKDADTNYGVRVMGNTVFRVIDTTIQDFYGIWAPNEVLEFTVRGSRLMDGENSGIALGAVSSGNGVEPSGPVGPTNVWIEGNFITNFPEAGIKITGTPKSIQGNTITTCGWIDDSTLHPHGGGVTFMFDGSYPQVFRDNTITNCAQGIRASSGACVEDAVYRDNDVFSNWYVQATVCGDVDGNWWNMDRWDGQALPDYAFQPTHAAGGRESPTQWSSEPFHPERLPQPVVQWAPQQVTVGETVRFDASDSLPSQEFGFPIESYAWHFGDCTPGAENQRFLVDQAYPMEVLAPFGHESTDAVTQHTFTEPGYRMVELVVTDEYGISRSWRQVVEVHDEDGDVPGEPPLRDFNAPPRMDAQLWDLGPRAGGPFMEIPGLTLEDPDGDSITARLDLYRNGALVPELSRTFTGGDNGGFPTVVPGSYMREGDEWTIRMTSCDGRHRGYAGSPLGHGEHSDVLEHSFTARFTGANAEPAPEPEAESEPQPEPQPEPESEPESEPAPEDAGSDQEPGSESTEGEPANQAVVTGIALQPDAPIAVDGDTRQATWTLPDGTTRQDLSDDDAVSNSDSTQTTNVLSDASQTDSQGAPGPAAMLVMLMLIGLACTRRHRMQ